MTIGSQEIEYIFAYVLAPSAAVASLAIGFVRYYERPMDDYTKRLYYKMSNLLYAKFNERIVDSINTPVIDILQVWGISIYKLKLYDLSLKRILQFTGIAIVLWTSGFGLNLLGYETFNPPQYLESVVPIISNPALALKIMALVLISINVVLALPIILKFGYKPGNKQPDPLSLLDD